LNPNSPAIAKAAKSAKAAKVNAGCEMKNAN
jgi:hypothetical protein